MTQTKSSEYVPLKRVKYKDKEYEILNVVESPFVYLKEEIPLKQPSSILKSGFRILKVPVDDVKPV